MDASTVGQTTVTVSAHATREQEIAILDSIYEFGTEYGFKPFYNKANDFDYRVRRKFTKNILQANQEHLSAFAHSQRSKGNINTQQIEAVQSALLVSDQLSGDSDTLAIVDGGKQKAIPFVKALSGLQTDLPVVAHCLQSEYYYPSALLADLAASYLAHSLENGEYDYTDPLLPTPHAKETRNNDWGKAFSGLYKNNIEYTPAELPSQRGDSVRERICCWYDGAVMPDRGAEVPLSDSLNPIVGSLRREGFEDLARIIEQL
ncbi:hypothetical protein [Halomontanus rarus]|uniref:hypothetical protein n=1 Tax=Halomontanus rarus TaxID=3034020 RepID=UPI00293BD89B|nr:hypothetical protein [Halovivax sp. KZCA124]